MADRGSTGNVSHTAEVGADGIARGISAWTWGMVAVLAAVVVIGALMIGGFFSLGQQGQKLNSENRTAERPAEP